MADSLPKLDPIQSLTPSWYHPEETSHIKLQPIHLYMGYAAMMAGAMGAWPCYLINPSQKPT